ncbi:hypothetical protein ASF06_18145 [Agreia sp. Leaf244]|nr:hypothetical protein ASF06_18145 [Agreia sp. Leaf244]
MRARIDVRDIRSDDLRFLAAVANTGNLSSAASGLGVDHSTVSRRLRALEKALKARLILKGLNGWELTDAGRAVIGHARSVQSAVELAAEAVADTRTDSIVGKVRVTSADGFGTLFVVPAIARVQARHPNLRVELVTGARELALRDSSFDLGITLGAPPVSRLYTERLCDYDAAFYASQDYLDKHGDPESYEELRAHSIIYFVDSLQRVRELKLDGELAESAVNFSSTNIFAQAEAARLGMGIVLLPKFIAGTIPALQPIAAHVPSQRVEVTLASRTDALDREDVLAVRAALHEEVRNRRSELIWNSPRAHQAHSTQADRV